eukprot:TRINITY_DN162_c1_g1_i13.p1 TRINITY_DN162_c1_g1~~TRINITY_DN162_c1_g1_i13.p1  ORF type:complete len:105 (-),score=19.15 TRINITY_DN162_c1_g1_i13:36-350(-)
MIREPLSEHLFEDIDKDSSGTISVREAENFYVNTQGKTPTQAVERVADILDRFDNAPKDGQLNRYEYESMGSSLRDDSTAFAKNAASLVTDGGEDQDADDNEEE